MTGRIRADFNQASEWVVTSKISLPPQPAAYADDADPHSLKKTGCGALTIGWVPDREKFSAGGDEAFVVDFTLIKRARDNIYHVPQIFAPYENTIKLIAQDQESRSANCFNKYAFIFLHRSHVQAGRFQRNDSWHCDSVPYNIRQQYQSGNDRTSSFYLVADTVPTVVQSEPVDNARSVFFLDGSENVTAAHSRKLDPYEIILMNDHVYHRGDTARESQFRTFMVVAYVPLDDKMMAPKPSGLRRFFS